MAPRTPLPALLPPYPEYMTPIEAARYLRFSSVKAFTKWARRRGLVPDRRGPKLTLWPLAVLTSARQQGLRQDFRTPKNRRIAHRRIARQQGQEDVA